MPLNEGQRKLQEQIAEDLRSVDGRRTEMKLKCEKLKNLWKGIRTRKAYTGRANISLPFPYWYTESMVPRYMGTVFSGREVFEVYPLTNGTWEGTQANKAIMNYQMMFEMEAYLIMLAFTEAINRKSMGILKCRWDPDGQHPELHLIRPGDYVWDPRVGPLWRRARWSAHFVEKDQGDLQAAAKAGGYIPEQVQLILQEQTNLTEVTKTGEKVGKSRAYYDTAEWWGRIPVDMIPDILGPDAAKAYEQSPTNKKYIPVVATQIGERLLRVVPNVYPQPVRSNIPSSPFLVGWDVHDPDEPGGWSEMEFIESAFNTASDMINQRLDNVTMAINRTWSVLKGSGVKREQLLSLPWGLVEVASHEDIKPIDAVNVTGDAYREVGMLADFMKSTTGMIDQQRGVDKPSVDTATGMQMLMARSDLRPDQKVKMFQHVIIAGLGDMMLQQNQAFLSAPKAGFIIGERDPQRALQRILPQEIQGGYRVSPMGFALAGAKDVRIGQLTNILNTLRGLEGMDMGVIMATVKEILSLVDIREGQTVVNEWLASRQRMAEAQRQGERANLLNTMRAQTQVRGPSALPGMPNQVGAIPASGAAVQPGGPTG